MVVLYLSTTAQDLHQTDYRLNPMLLNPAFTGSFHGTIRIGGVYREQFKTFINQAWQSPAAYIDSPISKGLREQDWIGVGTLLFSDQVGVLALSTAGVYVGGAYHLALDKDREKMLTLGVQYGQISRNIDNAEGVQFADELLDASTNSTDRTYIDDYDLNYSDLNVGLKFLAQTSDQSSIEFGGTVAHLLQPRKTEDFLSLRINLHGSYYHQLNERIGLEPLAYFSNAHDVSIVAAQFSGYYLLNEQQETWIKLGVGYRSSDAVQLLLGGTMDDWRLGLAVDLTTSQAAMYNEGFGSWEVGISKIIKIYKKPDVTPAILCPQF